MRSIMYGALLMAVILLGSFDASTHHTQVYYESTKIGNLEWMVNNLSVKTFRNGDTIPYAESDEEWKKASAVKQPAWCVEPLASSVLYNWYAVNDPRGLAPKGWHIPTQAEWKQLASQDPNRLKSKSRWTSGLPTNESGFSALPNMFRNEKGISAYNESCRWWCSDQVDSNYAMSFEINTYNPETELRKRFKGSGNNIRCVKD